jgi:hypothetical protein
MKPVNLNTAPCSPVSSNCVIWQGPNIPCINLCNGDTVSDVVFALATELCGILDTLDVANYDLSCFGITACGPNDFQALIQFLIAQICALQGVVPGEIKNTTDCPDCLVTVADCFVVNGQTTMNLTDYVNMIAAKICSIIDQLAIINATLTSLDIRVTTLENEPDPTFTIPSYIIGCDIDTLNAGTEYQIDEILEAFTNEVWCPFYTATGTTTEILAAIAAECISGTDPSRANPTFTMQGAYPSWNPTSNTLASTINHIWIALCDLYNASIAVADTNTVNLTYTAGILTANMQDTGWIPLNGFGFMSAATFKPYCRRIGNVIHFKGVAFIPMGTTDEGGGGTVIPFTDPDDYNDKKFGYTYNTLQATGVDSNAMLLKTYAYNPWTTTIPIFPLPDTNQALIAYFHREQSVIPTGILGSGETIDGSATVTGRVICERVARSNINHDIAMTTVITLGLGTTGTLFISSTNFNDIFRGYTNCVGKTSLVRQLCTQAISGENIPTYISTDPSQFNATSPGPYQAEIFGSPETYDFNQDSTRAEQLGGFGINLSGITAYVQNCSGLTPTFINC